MINVGSGLATATAPQSPLGVLRAEVLALLVGNPLFTDAEQLRANHNVHACECLATLIKWLANVRQEAANRAAVRQVIADNQATDWQRNCLKAAAWELTAISDADRYQLLQTISRGPLTKAEAVALLARLEQAAAHEQRAPATAGQRAQVRAYARHRNFTRAERAHMRLVLPHLTIVSAESYLHGLRDQSRLLGKAPGPNYRALAQAGSPAAVVEYVYCPLSQRLVPRSHGPLAGVTVRRLWVN